LSDKKFLAVASSKLRTYLFDSFVLQKQTYLNSKKIELLWFKNNFVFIYIFSFCILSQTLRTQVGVLSD